MPAPAPEFVPQAFAINAAAPFRNTIPVTTITPGRASFNLGFPPLTMQPVVAGGKPPLGQDVNGILYMISSHTVYQQTGQPYRWSADVVASFTPGTGYAVGTLLGSVDGATLWYNRLINNVSDPDVSGPNSGWVALWAYGIAQINGLTGAPRTLTAKEAAAGVVVLTGNLIANQQIILPNQIKRWLIINSTSGLFSTTVKTQAGTGVAIPQGGFTAPVEVWSDSINVYNVVAPVNLPIDQAANPLTIVQRTNAGYIFATYFNQSSAVENFSVAAVYADAGDGYHRKISPFNLAVQMPVSWFAGQVSNAQVPQSAVTQHAPALYASAALTGVPTAPTAAPGTNNSQIATTAFVTAVASVGFGQNWSLPGKNKGIGYANGTGRPIEVVVSMNVTSGGGSVGAIVNGVNIIDVGNGSSADSPAILSFIVPPGQSYSVYGFGSRSNVGRWAELV